MKPLSDATAARFLPLIARIDKEDIAQLSLNDDASKFNVQMYMEGKDGLGRRRLYQPSVGAREFRQRLTEHKEIHIVGSPYSFETGATDNTVELFHALWPLDQLFFDDELARASYEKLLWEAATADYIAEINANWKLHKIVPEHNYEFSAADPLSPYQQVALYCAMLSQGFALFMEQGTGKTPVSIAVICNVVKDIVARIKALHGIDKMLNVICVCPKNVRMNWETETEKFTTQNGKVTVIRGTNINRVKQLCDAIRPEPGCDFSLVVTSYETLTRSWDAFSYGTLHWDIAIADESHFFKDVRRQRYETMMKLRDISSKRLVLTGTPITNTALDLYAQLEFLGKGVSGFSSWETFKRFHGVYEKSSDGTSLVAIQNVPFMQERLARRSFIIRTREALPDLPPKVYDIHEVEMTTAQREIYREVATRMALEIEADLQNNISPKQMVISNALVKMLKLAQITSGHVVWPELHDEFGNKYQNRTVQYIYPNPKIEAVLDLMQGKPDTSKTLIWAHWIPDINWIAQALRDDGIDRVTFFGETTDPERDQAVLRFNEDRQCRAFVGNQGAGGVGLNLLGYPVGKPELSDTNADHAIYFSQDWSMPKRGQSGARNNRRGTRVHTRETDIVVPGTIDEEIRCRVLAKQDHALDISDIRAILKNCLLGLAKL